MADVQGRRVVATDLCLNSLKLGEEFRGKHGLDRIAFLQMNLFRPAFKPGAFDVVLCNGVLHHTSDPLGGFRGLAPLVKPGGYVVIGLYNVYGRLLTDHPESAHYEWLECSAPEDTIFVCYEDLCSGTEVWRCLARIAGITTVSEEADAFSLSNISAEDVSNSNLAEQAAAIYARLADRACAALR